MIFLPAISFRSFPAILSSHVSTITHAQRARTHHHTHTEPTMVIVAWPWLGSNDNEHTLHHHDDRLRLHAPPPTSTHITQHHPRLLRPKTNSKVTAIIIKVFIYPKTTSIIAHRQQHRPEHLPLHRLHILSPPSLYHHISRPSACQRRRSSIKGHKSRSRLPGMLRSMHVWMYQTQGIGTA